MKTINKILGLLALTLLLTACFGGDTDEVKDAKEELGVIKPETIDNILNDAKTPENDTIVIPKDEKKEDDDIEGDDTKNVEEKLDDNVNTGSPVIEKENPVIKSQDKVETDTNNDVTTEVVTDNVTSEKFINLTPVDATSLTADGIELSGTTIGTVDKIIVHFSNEDSIFPNDSYTLQKFQSGDKDFVYRAFRKYETFDYGKNKYLFVAYSGDKTSEVELVIDYHKVSEETEKEVIEETTMEQEENIVAEETISKGEEKTIVAADIDGLTLSESTTQVNCENVTDILTDKLNAWFYWNTCREINESDGYSYYVIRLEDEKYFYEKHYSHISGAYGVYLLETGEGVSTEDLAEMNATLKEKNSSYTGVKDADTYFNGL